MIEEDAKENKSVIFKEFVEFINDNNLETKIYTIVIINITDSHSESCISSKVS